MRRAARHGIEMIRAGPMLKRRLCGWGAGARFGRGVTAIEVMVGVGVMGALVGITAPVVMGVRAEARSAVCMAQERTLHLGMTQYTLSNRRRLPGVNDTGLRYMGSAANHEAMTGHTTPTTPVSTFDWVSPCLGDELGLSPNRAERTAQIFEWLACPEADHVCDALYEQPYPPDDREDFRAIQEEGRFRQISYLSPAAFHLRGPGWRATQYVTYRWRGPVVPPERYTPRLDEVGNPSAKIWVADGTRYLTLGGVLDFDVNPVPQFFGSFLTSGPIYEASTAYGRRPNRPQFSAETPRAVHEDNWTLSFRHAGGINAVYFDGSARAVSREESYTDAAPWYPRGSVFTGHSATAESLDRYAEGEVLY